MSECKTPNNQYYLHRGLLLKISLDFLDERELLGSQRCAVCIWAVVTVFIRFITISINLNVPAMASSMSDNSFCCKSILTKIISI